MRKRIIALFLSVLMGVSLIGCASIFGKDKSNIKIELTYLRNHTQDDGGGVFLTVRQVTNETDREKLVWIVLNILHTPPYTTCLSPFQNGVNVLSVNVEGNSVSVDLTEAFQSLSGLDQSVITASLTQSLCSIDGIDYVRITSNLESVRGRRDRYLSAFDLVFSADVFNLIRYDATLYLPDPVQDTLYYENSTITLAEDETLEKAIAGAVINGMKEKNTNETIIPKGSELLSTEVRNSVCYLNFSPAFAELSDSYGKLVLYSLVDSLCRLEYIKSVQFLIDGNAVGVLGGVDLENSLEADYRIVVY